MKRLRKKREKIERRSQRRLYQKRETRRRLSEDREEHSASDANKIKGGVRKD
jgi:hypothetical protein